MEYVGLRDDTSTTRSARLQILGRGGEIAFCHDSGVIQIADAKVPGNLRRLEHGPRVSALASSFDGAILASGSIDGTVKLWDWKHGTTLTTLSARAGPVGSIAWGPGDRRAGRHIRSRACSLGHGPSGTDPAMAQDGRTNALRRRVWSPGAGNLGGRRRDRDLRPGLAHAAGECCAGTRLISLHWRFSASGNRLVSSAADDTIRVWDVSTGIESAVLTAEGIGTEYLTVDPSARYAITGAHSFGFNHTVVCDLSTGTLLHLGPEPGTTCRFSVAGDGSGQRL